MENFEFAFPTKIIFGRAAEDKVGREVKKYGNKLLIHYGGGSIKRFGLYNRIMKSLKKEGIEVAELGGVKPNPRLGMVRDGIKLCRKENIKFILAVGGGSTIDSAKAIAIGVPYQGDVWDFYTKKAKVKESLPLGTVLTIPAAGSEVSGDSVITNEDGWYKRSGGEGTYPKFSILNPEISFTLSNKQTIIGVSDIMAHVLERYFTQVKNTELTDRLAEATLKTVINNIKIILFDPKNYNARAEIMWSGSVAHNNLLSTGRIPDWGSHMIEHEISAIYDIPHGEGLAIVFPAWMKYVYRFNIQRFAQFALRVFNTEAYLDDLEKMALEGIKKLEDFYREIGLPISLKEIGIGRDRLEEMAAKCVEDGPIGKFKELNKEDVLEILKIALK